MKEKDISMRNPFPKFIYIVVAVQVILLIIATRPGSFNGIAFLLASALSVAVLTLSIISIAKARNHENKGKAVGIVFTVLSSLVIILFGIAVFMNGTSSNFKENKYINNCINSAAKISVENLKDSLKDPGSLKINKIYAKAYDTRITAQYSNGSYDDGGDFKGYFEIYIDYTANNGLGGVNREYLHYEISQDINIKYSNKITTIPQVSDEIVVLNSKKFN